MSSKVRLRSLDSCSSNWSNGSRDKDLSAGNKYERLNVEHEMFLQAFEKPTQIYRYLRTRHLFSPIFLNRTLTYMRHRLSRNVSNKRRKDFSVDSLLKYVIDKKQRESAAEESSGNLTLSFLCANDASVDENSPMHLEIFLLKMCHKKRKDVTTPIMQYSVGSRDIPVNSDHKCEGITIAKSEFCENNGCLVKSYSLLFLASYKQTAHHKLTNGQTPHQTERHTTDIEDHIPGSNAKRLKTGSADEMSAYFKAELMIFDKFERCLLTDGEYTVVMHPCPPPKCTNKLQRTNRLSSWEVISDNTYVDDSSKQYGPMEVFRKGPIIRFELSWSSCAPPCVSAANSPLDNNENNSAVVNNVSDTSMVCSFESNSNNSVPSVITMHSNCSNSALKKSIRVVYQFLFNNNTRQQTKPRNDFHCPWCSLNCKQLYSLLKHLRLCHSRFCFTLNHLENNKCVRIDVSINECYDGSYAGNPHDLYLNTRFAFSRNGPVRRNPVTDVIVCRPKRSPHSLMEFEELDDEEAPTGRTCTSGHNRLYYHTTSCLPIRPQEMDYDSEAENDPKWMTEKTQLMIDEFTDVNEGEKEVMKLWNLHVMKNGFVGDCQIPLACSMFVEEKGDQIIRNNLYRNFLLHLCNLCDFGLLNASNLLEIAQQMNQKMAVLANDSQKNVKTEEYCQNARITSFPYL